MASKIIQEVVRSENHEISKKKDTGLVKAICKFYLDYVTLYEKNVQKGDFTFPTMPMRFKMFKTLTQYNSNDKVVEKRYRNVDLVYLDLDVTQVIRKRSVP